MRRFREPSIIDFTKGREALARAVEKRQASLAIPAGMSPSEAADLIVEVASAGAPRGSFFALKPGEAKRGPRPYKRRSRA